MDNQTILEVEDTEYLYWKDLKDSLERLEKNDDFKKVILQGYFKDKAVNVVSLLAIPSLKQQGKRPDIIEELIAISQLESYFSTIKAMGDTPIEDEEEN